MRLSGLPGRHFELLPLNADVEVLEPWLSLQRYHHTLLGIPCRSGGTMNGVTVLALAAVTTAGLGFISQDQPTTFEVARSSATPGAPTRFVIRGYNPFVSVRAASIETKQLGVAEAVTPATVRLAGPEPFHMVLSALDSGAALDLTSIARDCAATRFKIMEVANPLFRTDTTYIEDVEITCTGGTLVLLAKRATVRHAESGAATHAISFGRQITLERSAPGPRITVRSDFLTIGLDRR